MSSIRVFSLVLLSVMLLSCLWKLVVWFLGKWIATGVLIRTRTKMSKKSFFPSLELKGTTVFQFYSKRTTE